MLKKCNQGQIRGCTGTCLFVHYIYLYVASHAGSLALNASSQKHQRVQILAI